MFHATPHNRIKHCAIRPCDRARKREAPIRCVTLYVGACAGYNGFILPLGCPAMRRTSTIAAQNIPELQLDACPSP